MKAAMGQEKYLAIALALVALLLGGALFWEWDQAMRLEQKLLKLRKIPVTPVPEQKILPEFVLPEAQTGFTELIARSLFSLNRRSSPVGAKGGSVAMKKGQFVLVGVLITPQQRSALLRDVQTNKTETVALVGVVRGLTLGEVEPGRVVLRQGAESEELTLNVQVGPKGSTLPKAQALAAPPAAPPAPAAAPPSAPASVRATGANPPASAPALPVKPVEAVSAPKPPPIVPQPLQKK